MATAAAVNESRQDLLNWINDLLQMNVSKIEQVGTGAILCQIFDSIYGNVALHKVKFNTHQEFEYITNFKVLQACFTQNSIDKYIPVDRLIKLKYMENLEFLQWVKKFWDSNYPGGHYDAMGRRGGKGVAEQPVVARPAQRQMASMATAASAPRPNNIRSTEPIRNAPARTTTTTSGDAKINTLLKEIAELRLTVDEIEKERDFYFGKLRDIEIEVQKVTEGGQAAGPEIVQAISAILYKTEDGFEPPESNMIA